MDSKHQIVLNTCPDQESAKRIAESLVERGLAACVNILPGIESVYKWKGRIECDQECLLLIKIQEETYPRVEQAIIELHPYELPEIVAVPIANGLPDYLNWITDNSNTSGASL